ncbi:MAG TPA: RloB domain-containing protein [Candidatus Scybalomonas excrementigallinarum]|nr:RloB domain-containing protein [Candidatus Scybalomonas excrementigallinarum]
MARREQQKKANPKQIHVYCEGESEKIYLETLRNLVGIKQRLKLVVRSERKQGIDLYNHVRSIYKQHKFKVSPVEIVIIVDKDDKTTEELTKLKNECLRSGYLLIYSNVCFELWLLLHFEKVTFFTTRGNLNSSLSSKLGKSYKKTDKRFFEQVVKKYEVALKNSERMEDGIPEFNKNPYTNMKELLNNYFNV